MAKVMNRANGIGGSDAMRIMNGDWNSLYREKLGIDQPEDLSNVFKVQLGVWTESFHIQWLARQNNLDIDVSIGRIEHADEPWLFAHLDAWIKNEDTFLEVKHSGSHANSHEKARYYMPQLQHYMMVTKKRHCMFSVICGNTEPNMIRVDYDADYQLQLFKMEKAFWWHVQNKVEPEIIPNAELERIEKSVESIPVDNLIVVDMENNNEWTSAAIDYAETIGAAKKHEAAKDTLRGMIADNVGEAYGIGIIAKRDKRGRVSIRAAKEK